jgi:hypothetical protein
MVESNVCVSIQKEITHRNDNLQGSGQRQSNLFKNPVTKESIINLMQEFVFQNVEKRCQFFPKTDVKNRKKTLQFMGGSLVFIK